MKSEIRFFVVNDIKKVPSHPSQCFFLETNMWDDYGLKSTFHLYYRSKLNSELVNFGSVKFLKKNHESGFVVLPTNFTKLGIEYCSAGTSIDYYEKFKEVLGDELAKSVLANLRDCIIDKKIRAKFLTHEGFKSSLMRSGQDEEMFLAVGNLLKSKKQERDFSFTFATQISDNTEHVISFDFDYNKIFPYRTNVVVGKNGTGKTTFLANLARVYVGLDEDPAGYFIGDRPLFRHVIAVSYNPFDNFYIPNVRGSEREITKKNEGFLFGYKYLGIRKRLTQSSYALKSFEELEKEFKRALDMITKINDLNRFWDVLEPILKDSSFNLRSSSKDLSLLKVDFKKLSSGQKFVLLALTRLYINTRKHSLILLDEPENHLHPTIIMRFMQSIDKLLEIKNSYAIISTHSPIILQETPSRYVTGLDRIFDEPNVSKMSSETYGGSLNEIVQEVFKLSVEDSSFDKTMRVIFENGNSLSDIKELLQNDPNLRIKSYIRRTDEAD